MTTQVRNRNDELLSPNIQNDNNIANHSLRHTIDV